MDENPTILLAGGGTGGHLYPGLSVAQAIVAAIPGAKCIFLCTKRDIDRVILEPTGFEFIPQPIIPPVATIAGLLKFWESWRHTKDLVRQTIGDKKPVAVIGLGGYAAGVAVKLAALKKIPTAILNPDVIPGKANVFLMRYVKAVCCQFEATTAHVSQQFRSRLHMTGCPIREDILHRDTREVAAARLGLDPLLNTLVVTGASQGAATVNEATLTVLGQIKTQGWQVLHLSGRDHAEAVRKEYRDQNISSARVIDFTPAMADVWAVADLAISRAGASSCAELTACGIPSILMPYPFHKDMHQRANAQVLEQAGAAVCLEDQKDRQKNAARLKPIMESILYDASRRQAMADAARRLGRPDAAASVARVIQDLIKSV